MEFKHFSHHHSLVLHQPPQGSHELHCSGCKSRASGDVYACWQCNYFLHGQCFSAARSLRHPSHPLHPLTLVANPSFNNPIYPPPIQTSPYPTYPPPPHQNHDTQNYPPPPQPQITTYPPNPNNPYPNYTPTNTPPPNEAQNYSSAFHLTPANPPPPPPPQPNPKPPLNNMIKHFSHPHALKPMEIEKKNVKVCSACEFELSGSAYCCTEAHCTFNLHKACYDSPREIRHKSHLQHPLTLLAQPPYSDGFTCNACLKDGKAFVYTCATCSYDLHIDCVQWPDKVTRTDHSHPLTLYHSSPAAETSQDVTFMCDVCKNPVHDMAWVYYCRECDFGTHLECVTSGIKPQNNGGGGEKSQEELLRETELKFAVLQLLLEAQGRKAAVDLI
ncbi:hypothetical protein PHJA_002913600 [Phtheirospermum japonicum]|uniref:DC1 domain-containing protein n=1 Tax=Phtheirospermum japonicum TaxID=374723 RepID=A0A830DHC3_9LAMI|nr:hypothetical protein PHJA_002913600 [Phtheirospermum japonicum]